jgi:hypothetical protein
MTWFFALRLDASLLLWIALIVAAVLVVVVAALLRAGASGED